MQSQSDYGEYTRLSTGFLPLQQIEWMSLSFSLCLGRMETLI